VFENIFFLEKSPVQPLLKVFGDNIHNSRNANSGKLLNKPNNRLNLKKKHLNRSLKCHDELSESVSDTSERLIVEQQTIRVLLDTGSSGDLLFVRKGSQIYIPTMKRAVPQSWGTSNGTFKTIKVGEVTLSFIEYSLSKSVHLTPDIVEYKVGATAPLHPDNWQANLAQYRGSIGLQREDYYHR